MPILFFAPGYKHTFQFCEFKTWGYITWESLEIESVLLSLILLQRKFTIMKTKTILHYHELCGKFEPLGQGGSTHC